MLARASVINRYIEGSSSHHPCYFLMLNILVFNHNRALALGPVQGLHTVSNDFIHKGCVIIADPDPGRGNAASARSLFRERLDSSFPTNPLRLRLPCQSYGHQMVDFTSSFECHMTDQSR